jgi:Protein of unknown function (DUF2939)
MKKLFSLTAVLAVFALCGWFYFTPHLTLKSMKDAADSRNGEKLVEHVNFPLLREAIKARLNSKLSDRASKEGQTNPLSGLSTALFAKMVDPLVEKMLTPDNLMTVFKGNASALPMGRPQGKDRDQGKSEEEPKGKESTQDISMGYESFNRFSASVKKKGSKDAPVTIHLQREGIVSWKLIDIDFPL